MAEFKKVSNVNSIVEEYLSNPRNIQTYLNTALMFFINEGDANAFRRSVEHIINARRFINIHEAFEKQLIIKK
ncbi:hypothetical protein IJG72_01740 [bacterium]|nr:hypothetical protein [bacterium]